MDVSCVYQRQAGVTWNGRCRSKGTKLQLRRIIKPRDWIGSVMTIINNTVLNIGNVLREQISGALITHTKNGNYVRKWYVNYLACRISFHYVQVYQIPMPYTLNTHNLKNTYAIYKRRKLDCVFVSHLVTRLRRTKEEVTFLTHFLRLE